MRTVSPKLAPWLETVNKQTAALVAAGFVFTPTNAREGLANLTRAFVTDIPPVAWIADTLVPAPGYRVPVRIYHPAPEKALPVLVYFHGGGHMAGSVSVYEPICRKLALATQHIVVSADYRLAPECPYPAGLEDAYATAKYVWGALDARKVNYTRRLSLAGDSGGGALVAGVIGKSQFDASLPIHKTAMIYPGLDYTMQQPSMVENAVGYLLQTGKIEWYYNEYLQHAENRRDISPLYGKFSSNMPETLVISAEFCPLRDENHLYVEKMKAAGAKATLVHFDDMIHTFMNLEDMVKEECQKVYTLIGDFLRA